MAGTKKLRATSKGEEVLRRHRSIVGYLASSDRPKTTREIMSGLGLEARTLRTLQRDLETLRVAGAVDLLEHGWAAVGNRIEEELDRLLSIAAIEVFHRVLGSALPTSLLRGVSALLNKDPKAQRARRNLPPEEFNWLQALRIAPGYGWMYAPIIDRSVRAGIESAISGRRKAWIRTMMCEFATTCPEEGEWLVSVSHFVLMLPDRPAVVVWPDTAAQGWTGAASTQGSFCVLPLEHIQSVRVTNEPAELREWVNPFERHPVGRTPADESWTRYVLKISPLLIEQMGGTMFLKHLTDPMLGGGLVGRDRKGWGIYRFAAPEELSQSVERFRQGLAEFFERHAEHIEIMEPLHLRANARARAEGILRMYSDVNDCESEDVACQAD